MAELISAGTGFETESERVTAELLKALPKSWLVVANKFLVMGHGKSFEIDFVVVADHRIIVLDDKYWRGPFTGSTEFWTVFSTGESRRSPMNQADRNARKVVGFLSDRGIAFAYDTVQPVIGAIILTHQESSATINDPRAKHCLMNRNNAIEKLLWLEAEGQKAGFDIAARRAVIKQALYDQDDARRPKTPKKINFFRVEELVEEREYCQIYSAVHEHDDSRRTLYVYRELDATTENQLDRELGILRKLQSTRTVPVIESSFPWGENGATVVPVKPPDGVGWGALPPPASEEEACRRLSIAAVAFESLAQLHAAGVIHRRINPANVIVGERPSRSDSTAGDPTVTFTDFVFARVEGSETIAQRLDQLGFDDPYASPAITKMESYGFADASSDVYSLALVTLQTVMGADAATIASALESTNDLPVGAGLWPFIPDEFVSELRSIFRSALTSGSYKGTEVVPPQQIAVNLRGIIGRLGQDRTKAVAGPTIVDERYSVQGLLGEGAYARTYLVFDKQTEQLLAAKQYTRRDVLQQQGERIVHEFKTLWDNPHPNLPRPRHVDVSDPQFQLLLEYIPGETLRARLTRIANDRDQWANVMRGLLAAVQHLEAHGILHRDIKPDNVMIRDDDDHVFLIDHGVATSPGQRASLAGAPGYWPPEWKDGLELPPGADRYAAAVTLYETLTGERPFRDDTTGFTQELIRDLPDSLRLELHAVGRALLAAMSADPAQRPGTAADLRAQLEHGLNTMGPVAWADVESDPRLTGWVANLRGLFRNSRGGNADNRGLDSEFAKNTYVNTALDTALWPAILEHRPAAVFLSGNPGDGKTAFLEHVRDKLIANGASADATSDPSGWELSLDGHTYRACFDASESAERRSATEQLAHRLRGLEGETPAAGITVLVAINDGRLNEVVDELEDSHPWLIDTLDEARQHGAVEHGTSSGVWVIDLKRRAYVSLAPSAGEPSVMRQMLATMVDPARWVGDNQLAYHFPPAANAIALRSADADSAAERLEYLLALAHLRGDRHTTVRDLRSALALLITSDLDYAEYRAHGSADEYPWAHRYWNIAFTADARRDLVLGELLWLDPARFAHPVLERFLYFHHRPEDAPKRARLFTNGIDEPPPAGDDPERLRDWIGAVKRRLYFEGALRKTADPIVINPFDLVPYASARDMIAVLTGQSNGEVLKATILRGIGRSDDISAANTTTDLVLRVKKSEEHRIEMVKTFPADDFVLEVDRRDDAGLIETVPRTITLRHKPSKAYVRLNLDVIEVLTRLAQGLTPRSQELEPLIDELSPFKSRLQRSVSHQLLVIEGGRRHLIVKEGDRIIRRDV